MKNSETTENFVENSENLAESKVEIDLMELSVGIGDRLIEVRGKLTQQEFADSIKIGKSTLFRYEKEERLPDVEAIARICEKYDIDYTWLITGKGSPHELDRYVSIPQFDIAASAGMGAFVHDNAEVQMVMVDRDWLKVQLKVQPKDVSLINVRGDSMFPTLNHGDMLLVSSNLAHIADGIYVLRYGGMLQVKRLQWQPNGKVRITSDNPTYEPFLVDLSDESIEFRVIGKVIWTMKPMNS